jgi:hypothetical protein
MPKIYLTDLSFENKEDLHDTSIIADICNLIILNEFARKELIIISSKYVADYRINEEFDFTIPIDKLSFGDFIRSQYGDVEELKLEQFLLNLELIAIKLYNYLEIDKKMLQDTRIKKLRLTFAHKKLFYTIRQR